MSFDEYRALAERVPNHAMSGFLKDADLVSPIPVFHKRRMHLREFGEIPKNLRVIGDTQVSLNPVFGQGMTLGLMRAARIRGEGGNRKVSRLERTAYLVGGLASKQEPALIKPALDFYLRLCQRSKRLHRQFLKELHLL